MDDLRDHLVREHGRPCGELVGLPDHFVADLHTLDHLDEHLHLIGSAHRLRADLSVSR